MLVNTLLPIALYGTLSSAAAVALQQRDDCSNVRIFVFRGNDEPYPGRQGALTDAICKKFDACSVEHVEYDDPAASGCDAFNIGPSLGIQKITEYNKACPKAAIILTGYSQGGQIVGDILGGGGGNFGGCEQKTNTGLNPGSGPGAKIAAALLWGDGRHTANQPYNTGTGSGKDGNSARSGSQLSSMNKFSSVLRSYCVDTDPICARGNDGYTHTTYFDYWSGDAADWVADRLDLPPPSEKTSATPTPTPTPSSSSKPEETSSTSSSEEIKVADVTSSSSAAASSSASSSDSSSSSSEAASTSASASASSSSASSTASATYIDLYPVMTNSPSSSTSSSSSLATATSTITRAPTSSAPQVTSAAAPSSTSSRAAGASVSAPGFFGVVGALLMGAVAAL